MKFTKLELTDNLRAFYDFVTTAYHEESGDGSHCGTPEEFIRLCSNAWQEHNACGEEKKAGGDKRRPH